MTTSKSFTKKKNVLYKKIHQNFIPTRSYNKYVYSYKIVKDIGIGLGVNSSTQFIHVLFSLSSSSFFVWRSLQSHRLRYQVSSSCQKLSSLIFIFLIHFHLLPIFFLLFFLPTIIPLVLRSSVTFEILSATR